eukprot:COSAG02_NODE_4655_length_5128_cov_2.384569_3_plen_58_part_00
MCACVQKLHARLGALTHVRLGPPLPKWAQFYAIGKRNEAQRIVYFIKQRRKHTSLAR